MKLLQYPLEQLYFALLGAVLPLTFPLFMDAPSPGVYAQAAPPPVVFEWDWLIFKDLMICGVLGFIGGALGLVGIPIPVKNFRDGTMRILVAGATAAVGTGLLLMVTPFNSAVPAVRVACGAFMGFISYPLVIWGGKYGFSWLLKRVGIPETIPERGDSK